MKISDILIEDSEQPYQHGTGHPFRHSYNAYRLEDPASLAKAKQIFGWVVSHYGHSAPMPEIWITDHRHMQDAALRANHFTEVNGQIYGWYSQRFPNKIFLSDQVKLTGNKTWGAILAHELTHYLQDTTPKHEKIKPFQPAHVGQLESEADEVMSQYLKSQ